MPTPPQPGPTCPRWGPSPMVLSSSPCVVVPARPRLLKAYSHGKFLLQFQPLLAAWPFTQLDMRSPASDLQWQFIYFVPSSLAVFALSLSSQNSPGGWATAYSIPGPHADASKHLLKSTGRKIKIERSTVLLKTSPQGTFETRGC